MFTPPPDRCSSPAAGSYPAPTRSGSPVAAPFRVSLQRLPVAAGKLVGDKPATSYVAPPVRYSTDNLRTSSTPHGPKYACTDSGSAGSSPLPPAAAAASGRACDHAASTPAEAGIAATWHLPPPSAAVAATDTPSLLTATAPLDNGSSNSSNSSNGSSNSSTCNLPSIQLHQRGSPSLPAVQQQQCDDASMEQVIKDPVAHLMQQADAATAAGQAAAARAARQAAQAERVGASSQQAAASSTSTSTASSQPGVQVFSRNSAIQLETDLQALPRGQLLAAQQQHTQAWSNQQQQQWQQQLEAEPQHLQCFQQHRQQQQPAQQQQQYSLGLQLVTQQLLPWQQHTSRLMQQLTEQVAFHCVEHGRTLEALQDRHTELANALFLALNCLSQHHAALAAAAEASASALLSSRSHASDLQQQLSAQQEETQSAQQQLATLTAAHQQLQEDSQASLQQLQQLVDSLKEQLWQTRSDMEKQAAGAQLAAAQEAATSSRLLSEAEDEAADLRERLAFVHAQLQAVKAAQRREADTASAAVQTEAEQAVPEPEQAVGDQPSAEPSSGADTDTEDSLEDAPDVPKAVNLLDFVSRGTKRSRLWLVKLVGQVTADKAVVDAVADRQGLARTAMRDFVPAWSLNRYGLQHLSDQVLGDLCASICHHAAAGLLPARWFACFCGLGPAVKPKKTQRLMGPWQLPGRGYSTSAAEQGTAGSSGRASPAGSPHTRKALRGLLAADAEVLLGSAAAADFFVFCACQLAYPNSVVALFPEAQDALPLIRSNLAMESIKAAFRYLGDPSGQSQFVAEQLDLAAVPADAATTAAAGGGVGAGTSGSSDKPASSSSRPGTGGSMVGRFGFYDAWALLDLLLAEWLGRAWGRARTMGRLRRAVSALQPPLQEQYAAAVAAASASDSVHAVLLDKLQGAYADLLALATPDLQMAAAASDAADAGSSAAAESSTAGGQELGSEITQEHESVPPKPAGGTDPAAQLLQDAAMADAEGAWRAYKQLLSLVQAVLLAAPSEAEGTDASGRAGVGAAAAETPARSAPSSRATTAATAAQQRQQTCSPAGIVVNERLQRKLVAAGVSFAQGVVARSGGSDAAAEAAAASLAQQLAQPGALSSALAAALADRSPSPSLTFL